MISNTTRPTAGAPGVETPFPAAGFEALKTTAVLLEAGWDRQELLSSAAERGQPALEFLLIQRALDDLSSGRPVPAGVVRYSKRAAPGVYLGVEYTCSANGDEQFTAQESWEFGSFDHFPTPEEHRAVRFIRLLCWSGYRIHIEDVMSALGRIERTLRSCREAVPADDSCTEPHPTETVTTVWSKSHGRCDSVCQTV